MIDSNNQLKTLSKSLLNAVLNVMEATKDAGKPMTDKHKDLAAKAPPYDKVTHADVLAGRGVLKKHPTSGKLVTKEEVEEIEELSQDKLTDYRAAAKKQGTGIQDKMKMGGGDWSKDGSDTKTLSKRMAGYKMAGRKVNPGLAASVGKGVMVPANEAVEGLDELSNATLSSYERKSAPDRNRDAGNVMAKRKQLGTNTVKVASTEMNKARPKFEEVEAIDEALDAAARYGQHHVAIKELLKSIDQHVKNHKDSALKHKDYAGKKGVHWGHVGDLAQVHSHLADIHDRLAQQGEYKSSMVGESVEDYDIEQIAELSNKTLNTYRGNAYNDYVKKSANRMPGEGETDAMKKRMKSLNLAADKLTKEDHDFIESLNNTEIDEARGRPRKVPLPVGDVEPEPRQHIMQQLQRAKLSMRGGEDVVFKDGKKAHVSGAHAARVLTRYAGMKPGDKEDYQKKIGTSHEAFKEHM